MLILCLFLLFTRQSASPLLAVVVVLGCLLQCTSSYSWFAKIRLDAPYSQNSSLTKQTLLASVCGGGVLFSSYNWDIKLALAITIFIVIFQLCDDSASAPAFVYLPRQLVSRNGLDRAAEALCHLFRVLNRYIHTPTWIPE